MIGRTEKERKRLRLKGYDYSQPGAYFVTICTKNRVNCFGEIVNGQMRGNGLAAVVQSCWNDLPNHYPNAQLDEFVIMPNHVHGIIFIVDAVGSIHESTLPKTIRERRAMLLPKIVGRFKMNSAKRINELRGSPGVPVWQGNYFEHIIRNDKSLERIRDYIAANPQRWHLDKENANVAGSDEFGVWLDAEGGKSVHRKNT